MIDIRHLIEFLPHYFKDKDTYKVNGKGILERFLEICGDYFVDKLKTPIDNTLDLIRLNTTSSQYLAWINELIGQLPFANDIGTEPLYLTETQQRELVTYGNSLLKIRGTKEFFEIVFNIYSNSTNQLELINIEYGDFGWVQSTQKNREFVKRRLGNVETKATQGDQNVLWPYLDVGYMDSSEILFDEYYSIKQCVEVTFTIRGDFGGSDEYAKKPLKAFIEKYVPYNVKPIVKLNGKIISEEYSLVLEVKEYGKWVPAPDTSLNLESGSTIIARAYVVNSSGEKADDVVFTSSINDGPKLERQGEYLIYISNVLKTEDVYKFTLGSLVKVLKVKAIIEIPKVYFISVDPPTFTQANTKQQGHCLVTSYYTQDTKKVATSVMCLETGEIKTPDTGQYTTGWLFTYPGKYTFLTVGHTSTQAVYDFKPFVLRYSVKLAEAIRDNKSIFKKKYKPGPYTDNLVMKVPLDRISYIFVKTECNDPTIPQDKLSCSIYGYPVSKVYNGLMMIPRLGSFTFIPTDAKEGDGSTNASLIVVSENLSFSMELNSYDNYPKDPEISNEKSEAWALFKAIPLSTEARHSLDNGIEYMVQLPNGEVVEVPYLVPVTKEGCTMRSGPADEIRITTKVPGNYTVWVKIYPLNKVSWYVQDNRYDEIIPEGIMIVATGGNKEGWSGSNSSEAVYQLSPTQLEAKFRIEAYGMLKGNKTIVKLDDYKLEASDNNQYGLSVDYTEKNPKELTFRVLSVFKDGYVYKEAKLIIKDYDTVVDLRCTPSRGYILNGRVITRLNISSNKPNRSLEIMCKNTSDLYVNGDTFTAYEPKTYTFLALIDGNLVLDKSGNPVSCTFEVLDPTQITVSPEAIQFKADGTPAKENGNIVTIETGDNTEWYLEIRYN